MREEPLAEGRRLRGPTYRMTIVFHLPPLSEEEEAAALAQADTMTSGQLRGRPRG
jgi:hypothetical protein